MLFRSGVTESNENVLLKIGLTVGKGNKLELDEEALKKADINTLKTLFTGHNSFADKVSMKASSISNAAARYVGTYKSNGTYNNALSVDPSIPFGSLRRRPRRRRFPRLPLPQHLQRLKYLYRPPNPVLRFPRLRIC